ncbi:MAG: hypothetical protein NC816_06330, partial [Candidatus Omnitrophica bacterium]|nr:hypothetical protein [Candidatus Omnitrophota bacterium]
SFGFGPLKEYEYTDEFGFVWHVSPYEKTLWIVKRPFKDENDGIVFTKKLTEKYYREIKELKENRKQYREKYHNYFLKIQTYIGLSQLLSSKTSDEVKEVCKEIIKIAYPGYFIGSTTEIDNSAKLENVIAMYEIASQPIEKLI